MKPYDDRDPVFILDQVLPTMHHERQDLFDQDFFYAAQWVTYPLIEADPDPSGFVEMIQSHELFPLYLNL